MREVTRKMPRPKIGTNGQPGGANFVRPCTAETHMSHKRNFMREFIGKILPPRKEPAFCASLRSRNAYGQLPRSILGENLHEMTGGQGAHPDLTPALTPTVRTPPCGHAVWGTIDTVPMISPVNKPSII